MSRWLIELIAVLLLGGGFYTWWIHHDHVWEKKGIDIQVAADKAGAAKQKIIDDRILKEAKDKHANEIKTLQDAYLTPVGTPKRVMCYYQTQSSSVSESNIHDSTSTAPVMVQDDSRVYRERAAAFELLLKRADGLSADARQLEQETHASR